MTARHLWTRAALSLAIVSVGWILAPGVTTWAQDATGELTQDVPTAVSLTAEGLIEGDAPYTMDEFTQYGNWYGPGWWGGQEEGDSPGASQPLDALDAVAMEHDFAYQIAEEMGKKHGSEWTNGMKAIADQIAVRNVKLLPKDPRTWNPPPVDPEKAGRYRDRLQFGFVYYGGYNKAKSDFKTAFSGLKYIFNPQSFPKFDAGKLEADAKQRVQDWFKRPDVRPLFRLDLSATQNYLAEGEPIWIQATLVKLGYTVLMGDRGVSEASAALDVDGPAKLSASRITPTSPVHITATRRLFGLFSSVGKTITVTASHSGGTFDLIPSSIHFTVVEKCRLTLKATPPTVAWTPGPYASVFPTDLPCVDVTLTAELTTEDGEAVVNMPLQLAREDGATADDRTDANGMVQWVVPMCTSDLGGELTKALTFTVRLTTMLALDGSAYTAPAATAKVNLTKEDIVIVTGRVVDSRHGLVLAGASVTLTGAGAPKMETTDVIGQFRFSVTRPKDADAALAGSARMEGFETTSFTVSLDGQAHEVSLSPLPATMTGQVVDQKTGEPLDGATVRVTEPFERLIFTTAGSFTLSGLFVGDKVTLTAGAINHKAYTKSGKITTEAPSVTFRLPPGTGEVSSGLDVDVDADLINHSLLVWASPADPGVGQSVTVTAQVFPPEAGVLVEISMSGTDGYTSSITSMTNAMGKVFLRIPGAEAGVVDAVSARILGERVRTARELKYSF